MKSPQGLKLSIQWIVLLLCAFGMWGYFKDHQDELQRLSRIPWTIHIQLMSLLLVNNFAASFKLLHILRHVGLKGVSFASWFKIFVHSRFINFHVTLGANVYRVAKLKEKYHFALTKSIGTTLYFAWFEAVATLATAFILILIFASGESVLSGILAVSLFFSVAAPFVGAFLFKKLPIGNTSLKWFHEKVDLLLNQITYQIRDPKLSVCIALLTVFMFSVYTLSIFICFHALGHKVLFLDAVMFTVVLLLSRVINVTPGNVGLTEVLCGYLSAHTGASFGVGVLVSGLIRVLEYILIGFLSLIYLLVSPKEGQA